MHSIFLRYPARAALLLGLGLSASVHASGETQGLWADVAVHGALPAGAIQPTEYRGLHLDLPALQSYLARGGNELSLPRPDGGFDEFVLSDSGTMPAELAAKYPEIRSLRGTDGHGRRVRVDLSPLGFQAMVFDHDQVWIVRPTTLGDGDSYLSFQRAELPVPGQGFSCGVHEQPNASGQGLLQAPEPQTQTGAVLRNYRAAVATTKEYTAVFGDTVPSGLAAVVQAVNRVNEVYENDLSVHLTLVPNNDVLIGTSASSYPYSNSNGSAMLGQNVTNLNNQIGSTNYDIGHVFSTGGGGVAGLGVTCTTNKARGVTGLSNPVGDGFYIDYVAHEMGHQFGGNHTFNSTANSCNGNRSASSAYEPGSGTTIMAYAGICGVDNTAPHSDPYFHARSLQEINTWTSGNGGTCATNVTNPNTAPVIATLSSYTIPAKTPFTMTGSATDADGDALTYGWEQYDLGAANGILLDLGTGPILRSFNPTTSGTRVFPRLDALLTGTSVLGELLPTTTRTVTFRLTVRDNHPGGGTSQSSDIAISVSNAAGPFVVTSAGATPWSAGETRTVTWNVAGTNAAPVNCANVRIDLAPNGDVLAPVTVLASTPNNGSADVTVPNVSLASARVKVSCANNVFFNVSGADFVVNGSDLIFKNGFE